jgi:hypothetical protein
MLPHTVGRTRHHTINAPLLMPPPPPLPLLLQAIKTFLTAGEDLASVLSALDKQITHMLKLTGSPMRDLPEDVPCSEGVEGFTIGTWVTCRPCSCMHSAPAAPDGRSIVCSLLLSSRWRLAKPASRSHPAAMAAMAAISRQACRLTVCMLPVPRHAACMLPPSASAPPCLPACLPAGMLPDGSVDPNEPRKGLIGRKGLKARWDLDAWTVVGVYRWEGGGGTCARMLGCVICPCSR